MNKLHSIEEAITILQQGGVGVLPTDTVYGLVARAADPEAVAKLYDLKHRERKPGTTIAASIEQLVDLGIKARYLKAVERFWPGAVSIEIPHSVAYLNQGVGRSAFRVVGDETVRDLLLRTGPLVTSSANQPGEPPANTLAEAEHYFHDSVDFYVDGGDLSDREPSTLIKVVDDAIEIVRIGAVKIDEAGRITR